MNDTETAVEGLLGFLSGICPNRPGDTLNDPLVWRLHLLLQAARAIAAALPDNGGLGVAEAADLTLHAYATADHVRAKANQHLPSTTGRAGIIQLPAGYSLPTFTETATPHQ